MSHTPRPWVRLEGSSTFQIVSASVPADHKTPGAPDNTVIGGCGCCDSPYGNSDSAQSAADLALILAAPDLLAALKGMVKAAQKQEWGDHYPSEMEASYAAIGAAVGKP